MFIVLLYIPPFKQWNNIFAICDNKTTCTAIVLVTKKQQEQMIHFHKHNKYSFKWIKNISSKYGVLIKCFK